MTDLILTDARPHVNGKAPRKPARSRKPATNPGPAQKANRPSTGRVGTILTVATGCGIPALSLSLSSVGGSLLQQGYTGLGVAGLGLCCAILAVSLSHLAAAIGAVTRSRPWQAWALAVAIDVTLVTCELTRVAGFESWLVPVVMTGVTLASMCYNVRAMLAD
jgi:hypothetical protein